MGRTATYQYALDDRITKKDYSDTSTPDVAYAYDTWFARLTSRQDGAGTTTFTYHPYGASTPGAGQVAPVNGPLANDTQKHTYDQLGRLKKLEIVDDATQSIAEIAAKCKMSRQTLQNYLQSQTARRPIFPIACA